LLKLKLKTDLQSAIKTKLG